MSVKCTLFLVQGSQCWINGGKTPFIYRPENKPLVWGTCFWLTFPWAGGGKITHIGGPEDVGPWSKDLIMVSFQ